MTFLTLQSELADRLVAYNMTVSDDLTRIKRWINMGIQHICGKRIWPFLLSDEIVQTVADYTTGTASVSLGGTTVTFSATISDSKLNQYIRFASSNDWYRITSHTAGTATATIDVPATGANVSTVYTIRKLLYTTTTPLIQILEMKQLITPTRLINVSPMGTDFLLPLYYDSGMPYSYTMSSPSSAGTPQFSFIQSPSTVMNIMVRGIKVLADLSADADIPVIPVPWQDAIINIAAYYGFQGLDDTRVSTELMVGEKRIEDMAMNLSHSLGRHRVMQSIDNNSNFGLEWALPSNFGPQVP